MERILQVSESISSSCSDPQATRLISLSSDQLTRLATQLSCAARSCWQRPRSRAAWSCFEVVRQLWEQELTLLLDTLDSVTSLSDFLFVVELHLQQHLTDCIAAVEKCDVTHVVVCKTGVETVSTRLLCIVEGFLTHGDVVIGLQPVPKYRTETGPNCQQNAFLGQDRTTQNLILSQKGISL